VPLQEEDAVVPLQEEDAVVPPPLAFDPVDQLGDPVHITEEEVEEAMAYITEEEVEEAVDSGPELFPSQPEGAGYSQQNYLLISGRMPSRMPAVSM
jgi:hypothetical protein